MEQIILQAVEVLKKSFGGIEVEVIDTEMSRKYPDSFAPSGYLGVSILVDSDVNKHRVFLKYQDAEDILYSMVDSKLMAESYIMNIINVDLPKLMIKYKKIERKEKLRKINDINNKESSS